MGVRRGVKSGANPGGAIEAIAPTYNLRINLIYHDCVRFG